jgi:hypothetical protein
MRNVTATLTDEQYNKIHEFIIKNRLNGGQFKSFVNIFQHLVNEFIKNNINSLPAKETAAEIPAPKETVVESNPFEGMNIRF